MSKIHTLKIQNFQGIENFEQQFNSDFICIIGRGDSGKTTILKAISYILHPNWNLSFYDTDFFNCNINVNIEIEATLFDVPEKLLQESKYGLHIRGINKESGELQDEINDDIIKCLTIKLIVTKDLEPKWYVVSNRGDDIEIRAGDRALFNAFFITDYIDKHFSWNRGTPLYSLLKEEGEGIESNGVILESVRAAKKQIDREPYTGFDSVLTKVKASAGELGLNASTLGTTIDFRDISITEGKVSLHDNNIPFRQKGKGTKRLLSMAIQHELVKKGGIILIDEIEQGLEPDRVQHLVSTLKKNNKGQIFITTHSSNVIVELKYTDLYLKKYNEGILNIFYDYLQGCIRNSPEAFFSRKIIVCEGATEVGICRALNNYRISQGKENMSSLGVKVIDGTGSGLESYCNGLIDLGYEVCLFCDSDVTKVNDLKAGFRVKNINIIDWDDSQSLEKGIFNSINFDIANKLFNLAINLEKEEKGGTTSDIYTRFKQSLDSIEGINYPDELNITNFDSNMMNALGIKSGEKSWYKSIYKGEQLGNILLENYPLLGTGSKLKENFDELSNWIEND